MPRSCGRASTGSMEVRTTVGCVCNGCCFLIWDSKARRFDSVTSFMAVKVAICLGLSCIWKPTDAQKLHGTHREHAGAGGG